MLSRHTTRRTPKSIPARDRTAFHEAGHAVLSAAIANPPEHVTIKPDAHTLGRSGARRSARPMARVQVHLAGFAAEHLLTGRRPRQLDQEIGFSLVARLDPDLGEAYAGSEIRDGHRAVEEVIRIGTYEGDDAIRREVYRFYEISRESLSVVWPAVKAVAETLLRNEEIDRDGFEEALGDADLYAPVLAIQRAHGLVSARPAEGEQRVAQSDAPARAAAKQWKRPPGVPEEMTEDDFQQVVDMFRILQRWRDEAEAKKESGKAAQGTRADADIRQASRGSVPTGPSSTRPRRSAR